MNNNFIQKLETENYFIGSLDVYIELSKKLIMTNSKINEDKADDILKSMPTNYRASIVSKDGNYIGYIGLYDVDAQNGSASIRFETNNNLNDINKEEILNEFKKYSSESLNINKINEFIYSSDKKIEIEKTEIMPKCNILLPSKLLVPGITNETLENFSSGYSIPKLQMPFTIKSKDKVIGIIGLSNLIWSNRRATLNLFLKKDLGDDIVRELSGTIIDEYINYVHESNIHNVMMSVNGSNNNMLNIINNTFLNYYGQIMYGAVNEENIESNFMFQHIPYMKKDTGVIIPENQSVSVLDILTKKEKISPKIKLGNGYKMISPKIFEENDINLDEIVDAHINAMKNRSEFTIPLGEDKYFLQKGNDNYGIFKVVKNYSYVILDDKNNYSGYINILRTNGKNAEIEIGIDPKLQHHGLGTMVINKFSDELFSAGYAGVTSAIFEFNKPSLKLHEKVAQFNGTRIESYYINGKYWDMNYYTKINSDVSTLKTR